MEKENIIISNGVKEVLSMPGAGENNGKKEMPEQSATWEKIQQTEAVKFLDVTPETEENIKNNPELRELLGEILNHDKGTFEHCLRTADLARELNDKDDLGFDEKGKEIFFTAALLHDTGKVYVDKKILNKPGKLSDEENAEIDRHIPEGIEHLKGKIPEELYKPVALIIGSHHRQRDRRINHREHPFGPETGKILRIFSIVDEFDSLLYERPYKGAMPINQVRELLRKKFRREEDGDIIDLLYNYKKLDLKSYLKKQKKVMDSPWHKQETEKDLGYEPDRNEVAQHFMDKKYSEIFSKRNKHLRTDVN
ncbi:MAG: HD domain-containing protein [Patescibacteria group bacterium]|nr:HD domain-containing protein [Patescibacteria group bacterium]MDD5294589.1 HD domain-containing protein [Patescibacteria group bacterium]MDD5554095.1 HD domain-containing protein [Patescibacteria group bacterium]